jgi:hypothetical protein
MQELSDSISDLNLSDINDYSIFLNKDKYDEIISLGINENEDESKYLLYNELINFETINVKFDKLKNDIDDIIKLYNNQIQIEKLYI